jgi:bifunctional N-acetylglucosamine-1-phosphate-uridyltransferase/glucosamine-1-phosphate-acetyltransferase GlmU-like protein
VARILDYQNGGEFLAPSLHPAHWTVLIPAAGRGTRLAYEKPKILFPVGGVSILERLVSLLKPLCDHFVFVLSPDGTAEVTPQIELLLRERGSVAIQETPRGMADAVVSGLAAVRTEYVVIVWGDQVALKPASLEFCMRLIEGPAAAQAVCPTLLRQKPYIHFERDAQQTITQVLQRREGDVLPAEGESDSGVFFFRVDALRQSMNELLQDPRALGRETREVNFLPIFPLLDAMPGRLITARIMSEAESVGVNTKADAAYIEAKGA